MLETTADTEYQVDSGASFLFFCLARKEEAEQLEPPKVSPVVAYELAAAIHTIYRFVLHGQVDYKKELPQAAEIANRICHGAPPVPLPPLFEKVHEAYSRLSIAGGDLAAILSVIDALNNWEARCQPNPGKCLYETWADRYPNTARLVSKPYADTKEIIAAVEEWTPIYNKGDAWAVEYFVRWEMAAWMLQERDEIVRIFGRPMNISYLDRPGRVHLEVALEWDAFYPGVVYQFEKLFVKHTGITRPRTDLKYRE